jgi:outer membrane lipoprotein-sorting protein
MKLNSFLLLALLLCAPSLFLQAQEEARVIFEKAVDQLLTNQMELSMQIETTDNRGRITEKEYDILMASFGDTDKMRMIMQQPERAKGITVVITQQPEEEGMIEVFTPSNGKVRKMKATPENLSRVGSGFVLSDYATRAMDDMKFSLIGTEEVEGSSCYLLEAREAENPSANLAAFYIDEQSYLIRQIRIMNEAGEVVNTTRLSDYQPVEGMSEKVYPIQIQSENFEEQSVTRMHIMKVVHRSEVQEGDFVLETVSEGP